MKRASTLIFLPLAVLGLCGDAMGAVQEPGVDRVETFHDFQRLALLEQANFLRLAPPEISFVLQQDRPSILLFNPATFPKEFVKGLVAVEGNDYPVYPVTVIEEPTTRARLFVNARSELIFEQLPSRKYSPETVIRILLPDLWAVRPSGDDLLFWLALYDPARIRMRFHLVTEEDWAAWQAQKLAESGSKQAQTSLLESEPRMMTIMSPEPEALALDDILVGTSNSTLVVVHPSTFTNGVDIFGTTNLLSSNWAMLAEAVAPTNGTTSFNWLHPSSPAAFHSYAVADATVDTDGDGLADGREVFHYKTARTNSDTDGDGMPDGWEVWALLNPLLSNGADDPDNDGAGNYLEYLYGRHPRYGAVTNAALNLTVETPFAQ